MPVSAQVPWVNWNSVREVLIYWQKDLNIYQDGSSDHINQLFKGLGDTMHGKSFPRPEDFRVLRVEERHQSDM
jgi:hypothetical protein